MITNTDRAEVALLHLVVVVSGCPEAAGPADVELVIAGLCLEVGEEQEDPAARGHPAHTASLHRHSVLPVELSTKILIWKLSRSIVDSSTGCCWYLMTHSSDIRLE